MSRLGNRARDLLRDFLTALSEQGSAESGRYVIEIGVPGVGSVLLCEKQSRQLDAIVVEFEKRLAPLASRRGIEKRLRRAIIDSLIVPRQNCSPPGSIAQVVSEVRTWADGPPLEFNIYVPIYGLKVSSETFRLGNTEFLPPTDENLKAIKSQVLAALSPTAVHANQDEQLDRYLGVITDAFRVASIARTGVQALDDAAATEICDRSLQKTIRLLNFYTDIAEPASLRVRVADSNSIRETTQMLIVGAETVVRSSTARRMGMPLQTCSLEGGESDRFGLRALQALLEVETPNKLATRLLSSIEWCGRGTACARPEEALLCYVVALESLLLDNGKNQSQLSYQLALRAASILGVDVEGRREIFHRCREIYGLRSKVVHGGFTDVTEEEIEWARQLAKRVCLKFLQEAPFRDWKSVEEMNDWVTSRLLS